MSEAAARPTWRDVDWLLLGAAVALALIGLAFIESARGTGGGLARETSRQAIYLLVGVAAFAATAWADYQSLARWAWPAWLLSVGLLVAVLVVGVERGGARSWLRLGGLSLQPSELAKVAVVLLVAALAARRAAGRLRGRDVAAYALVVGLPMVLVAAQNDLGSAVTFVPLLAAVTFVSGLRWRWVVAAALAVALLAPVGWSVLKPYQRERFLVTYQRDLDSQGAGWNARQARIAVGSGGLLGRGYGQGPQNRLGFLPERHTDFIFAIVAEERGFVGAITVLGLFLLLLQRVVRALAEARDRLGALVCLGALSFLAVHVLINVGMVLGLLPVIGVPLPLLSFGGSALLATFCLLGLVEGVRMRRFAP